MTNFKKLGIPESMLNSLVKMNFTDPTPIQEQAIPIALEGRDILGSAQTGTGKTGAFAIPMINHLINNDDSAVLVLLPTRELATQVLDASSKFLGKTHNIKSALLIGGDPISKQLQQLRGRARLIVGTPGRVNDHLERKSLHLDKTTFLVLDETDRMLDMGFGAQLNEIAKFLPEKRQTLMFSATMPKNIVSLSKKYLTDPVRIAIGNNNEITPKIKQEIFRISDDGKYDLLVEQINLRTGSILVFVKTKYGADRLARKLNNDNISTDAIHGDLKQRKRERVIADFRKQKFRVLVATDIAARGLDIPHIENVVNYDLPQCPEDYIHRIGRTGRAGAEGVAINFLTNKEGGKWKEIQKILDPNYVDDSESTDEKNTRSRAKKSVRFNKDRRSKNISKDTEKFSKNSDEKSWKYEKKFTEKSDEKRSSFKKEYVKKSDSSSKERFSKFDKPFRQEKEENFSPFKKEYKGRGGNSRREDSSPSFKKEYKGRGDFRRGDSSSPFKKEYGRKENSQGKERFSKFEKPDSSRYGKDTRAKKSPFKSLFKPFSEGKKFESKRTFNKKSTSEKTFKSKTRNTKTSR